MPYTPYVIVNGFEETVGLEYASPEEAQAAIDEAIECGKDGATEWFVAPLCSYEYRMERYAQEHEDDWMDA